MKPEKIYLVVSGDTLWGAFTQRDEVVQFLHEDFDEDELWRLFVTVCPNGHHHEGQRDYPAKIFMED